MKTLITKIIVLAFLLCSFLTSTATIITVDNNENAGAIYTVIQDAIDAAAVGDTLIVAGSETAYGGFTLNKQLVIIGAGYNPQGDGQFAFSTNVSGAIYVYNESDFLNLNASGSHLEGMYIDNYIYVGQDSDETVENITITKCRIRTVSLYDIEGLRLYNNLIETGVEGSDNTAASTDPNYDLNRNILIFNNIFTNDIYSFTSSLQSLTTSSIIISNNIFTSDNTGKFAMSQCKNIIFTNNIIYGTKLGEDRSDCDFCSITNNLIVSDESLSLEFGTNSTGNNLENVDPMFTLPKAFDADFSLEDEYVLQAGSPAIDAGSDGTDLGIYGGAYPWPQNDIPFATSPESQLPKLTDFNIRTAAVPEDGSIEIDFKARVSANQ